MTEFNKKLIERLKESHINGLGLSLLALGKDSSIDDWKQVIQSYPEFNLSAIPIGERSLEVHYTGHFFRKKLVEVDLNTRQAYLCYHPHIDSNDDLTPSVAYLQGLLDSQGISFVYDESRI